MSAIATFVAKFMQCSPPTSTQQIINAGQFLCNTFDEGYYRKECASDVVELGYVFENIHFDFTVTNNLTLPNDLANFYLLTNGGLMLNNNLSLFHPLKKIEPFNICWPTYHCEENLHITNKTAVLRPSDWFSFYHDSNSVDNGMGRLYTNLNPTAAEFGCIYAYSSSDDGITSMVAPSFEKFAHLILNGNTMFPPWDSIKYLSLCDYYNYKKRLLFRP